MPRPVHLGRKASLDEAPVGAEALRRLALLKLGGRDERHHVDVDRVLGVLSHWEAVTPNIGVHVDWSQIKRLRPVLVSLRNPSHVLSFLEVFLREADCSDPVDEQLLPDPPHHVLASPQLGEKAVRVVESVEEHFGDRIVGYLPILHFCRCRHPHFFLIFSQTEPLPISCGFLLSLISPLLHCSFRIGQCLAAFPPHRYPMSQGSLSAAAESGAA